MRSATDNAMLAALAALCVGGAGCGNYSTEDLRFLSALPQRQHLILTVPASTGAGPTALTSGALVSTAAYSLACPAGTTQGDAEVWKWAKPTSDDLNRAVTWIVGLIDNVRKYPPTHRGEDSRRWGPFDDDNHPGRELQVVIDRSWPTGPDGPPRYDYRFEARVKGTPAFTQLITGYFIGASSARGDGLVTLDFQKFWDVGVNEADTPHGTMVIKYSRSSDPLTTDLDLRAVPAGGFGVVSFAYGYAGWASGLGAFDYKFERGPAPNDVLEVKTGYDAAGAGRLRVTFTRGSDGATGSFDQCFDAAGCLVYVYDPANFNGLTPTAPYVAGSLAACAPLPPGVGPFVAPQDPPP
jgi:hypothetical protein